MPLSASAKIAAKRARSVYLLGSLSHAKDKASKDQLQLMINPASQVSTLSTVRYLLVTNESFWANSTLETLWLLLSTSHEIRKEILGIAPQDPSIFMRIVKTIFAQRTVRITISDAMRRFFLSAQTIFSLNTRLPGKYPPLYRKGQIIQFSDVFDMAMSRKGGLATVTKLRARAQARVNKAMKKVLESAEELHRRSADDLDIMMFSVQAGIVRFESRLNGDAFRFKITVLKTVRDSIAKSETMVNWLRYVIETPQLGMDKVTINRACKTVEECMTKTIECYNSQSHVGKYIKFAY